MFVPSKSPTRFKSHNHIWQVTWPSVGCRPRASLARSIPRVASFPSPTLRFHGRPGPSLEERGHLNQGRNNAQNRDRFAVFRTLTSSFHNVFTSYDLRFPFNRPFPRSTSVSPKNGTRTRLGWTFSYVSYIFVHPDFHLAPLFTGVRERCIGYHRIIEKKIQEKQESPCSDFCQNILKLLRAIKIKVL